MQQGRYSSFREFYPFYLSQHQHPVNRLLHVIGTGLVMVFLFFSLLTQGYWYLLLLPVIGYGFAWVGHFFFEKNKPATFEYPLYSLLGDFVMFKDVMIGKIKITP